MAKKTKIIEEKEPKSNVQNTKPIFVKVSNYTRAIIDKFKQKEGTKISSIIENAVELYDKYYSMGPETIVLFEKYLDKYDDKFDMIEDAMKLLDKQLDKENSEDMELWVKAKEEMNMVLLGKTTFNQLIAAAGAPDNRLDKPMKKNIGLDLLVWHNKKSIKNLTLEEIIYTIQKIWKMANHFYMIEVNRESSDTFHMIFRHHQNKRYSNYWLGYFKELFQSKDLTYKIITEEEALDETLSMTVKKVMDK